MISEDSLLYTLRDLAMQSTCLRARAASIIVAPAMVTGDIERIIGSGWNSKPCNINDGTCIKDALPADFKSDKTCCVHAEHRAIMHALRIAPYLIRGSTLYFLRFDEQLNPVAAGAPYCTICSKMALDAGVRFFGLMHKEGWTLYPADEYNRLSFAHADT